MSEQAYVVGVYVSNADPALRISAFIPLTTEYRTLAAAQRAAEEDYTKSHAPATGLHFALYRSDSGDAIVEVSHGSPFRTAGFYKIARVEDGADAGGEA